MQLLKIALYNIDGRIREVDFKPGELNIVTGKSRTGKSAILTIVDYCLGRDKVEMPPGVIRKHVQWFATLWTFDDGSRVMLARPALAPGRTETNQMMVTFGGSDMQFPPFESMVANSDSNSAREVVGTRIGLVDAKLATPENSLRPDTSISLGAAALFCFQEQQEVANKSLLFHRQNDEGISITLRDTLPFFLGALPGDNAAKHARLRAAKRELRAAKRDAQAALDDAEQINLRLSALITEAHEAGMLSVSEVPSTSVAVELLSGIRLARPEPISPLADLESQDRRRTLEAERATLRFELGQLLDDRALLLDVVEGEGGFGHAVGQHKQRLASLGLLQSGSAVAPDSTCPVCRQALTGDDPLPVELNHRLETLSRELETMTRAEPARRSALEGLDAEAQQKRERLIALEVALRQIETQDADSGSRLGAERREFIRGRIDATLSQVHATDDLNIGELQRKIEQLEGRVRALEEELDDHVAEQRLRKVVTKLSDRITELALELEVENADGGVWLDVERLTVVLDTDTGPATLGSMGSGANWLGIHLAVHLALHEFFVTAGRPVPRILMLDQPTQVFYETQYVGEDELTSDGDHDEVARMFKLMHDVAKSVAPGLQIIVSDHANLSEPWFADSVRHNWRHGEGLVPKEWIEAES